MSEASQAAAVLEDAADWLLVNGRCRDSAVDDEGRGCVIYALLRAVDHRETRPGYKSAMDALTDQVWTTHHDSVVTWNERTEDDDEVRDTLLLVAKQLRGEAKP